MLCSTRSAAVFAATSLCVASVGTNNAGGRSFSLCAGFETSGWMTDRKESISGEDSLIALFFRPIATEPGAFKLVDDAAVLKALGEDIVVTTDAIVEGVHFLPDDPPETIARKALRVNL